MAKHKTANTDPLGKDSLVRLRELPKLATVERSHDTARSSATPATRSRSTQATGDADRRMAPMGKMAKGTSRP